MTRRRRDRGSSRPANTEGDQFDHGDLRQPLRLLRQSVTHAHRPDRMPQTRPVQDTAAAPDRDRASSTSRSPDVDCLAGSYTTDRGGFGCDGASLMVVHVNEPRDPAVEAAIAAGVAAGFPVGEPVILQDTNNVVVWLRPHPVIAKVGVRQHVRDSLRREVEVCQYLHAAGAPVGEPIAWYDDEPHPVSLWSRLEATRPACSPRDHADALRAVHGPLRRYSAPLPSYWAATESAKDMLFDDERMHAIKHADAALLRDAYRRFADQILAFDPPLQPLHSEPHTGNIIATADRAVLIDFEAVSVGPIEWDIACCPAAVAAEFPNIDHDLVRAARLLNAVRVATWCGASPHPAMRPYGVEQLEVVRRALRK